MREILRTAHGAVRIAWWWLRQVSGDAAYENYLQRVSDRTEVLSQEKFYLEKLERQYTRASRCC